jgi:hypothetical protein
LIRPLRKPEVAGWVLMAAAMVAAACLVFWLERGLTFGWDEFAWLEIGGLAPVDRFHHPYGGHLIVVPYYLWRGTLELFGISFTAFSVIQVIGLSLMAALLYVYGKRRIGPLLALAPAVVLLFLGGSYPVLLEPMIGIQFLAALVPGLAAILALEREDLPGDVAACALLCLALAGFSEALPFLVGAIIAVALSPNWKKRLWVVAIPVLAYGYWRLWAAQFEPTGIDYSNVPLLPLYFVDALAVFAMAVFGMVPIIGPGPWSLFRLEGHDFRFLSEGIVFIVVEVLVVAAAAWALRRRGPIPKTLWTALGMLVVLAVELGVILAPGRTAAEPRYLYAGVLLLLLVVIELARGVRPTRLAVAVTIALTAAALVGNAARFSQARQHLDAYSKHARADMAVIELAGKDADQAFTPNLDLPQVVSGALTLNTGSWQAVVDRYGSSAYSIPQLRKQSEDVRAQADRVAVRALRLKLVGTPAAAGPRCRPVAGAAAAEVVLPPGGAVLKASGDSEVSLRRWADSFAVGLGELGAGQAAALRIPTDASSVPWRVRVEGGDAIAVCPAE